MKKGRGVDRHRWQSSAGSRRSGRGADPRPGVVEEAGASFVRLNLVVDPRVPGFSSPDEPAWVTAYEEIASSLAAAGVAIYGRVGAEIMPSTHENYFRTEQDPGDAAQWIGEYVTSGARADLCRRRRHKRKSAAAQIG
jgi:hypothetical protein